MVRLNEFTDMGRSAGEVADDSGYVQQGMPHLAMAP
jgi:hypothetical protein